MILDLIIAFIMMFNVFFIWTCWNDTKIKVKCRTIALLSFTSFITVFNYKLINPYFRLINMTIVFIILYKIIYKVSLKESITKPLLLETLYIIAETVYSIIILLIIKNHSEEFINNYFGSIFSNLCISVFVFLLSKLRVIKNIEYRLSNVFLRYDEIKLIFISIFLLLIYAVFAVNSYYKTSSSILLIMSGGIFICTLSLTYIFFKTKDDYYKINDRYNSSLLSLKELENVLTNQRIDNHENEIN